ncbi:carbohydrate kinase family protein [Curtobacterium ammoniigenes]|uniref:carbohydrate kinase family protein n=1 Tax=Curtobacterium ammoniigenes TaxID=395387 RepID=UPI00082F40C3|nr:carbohydrate kinase family protein [Curtobacterium ammoniigenes]
MPNPAAPDGADLLFTGEVFCDLVFSGVDAPAVGTEVYANGFAITPGGVANRAVAAARVGARTKLLAVLGDDPLGRHIHDVLEAEPDLDTTLLRRIPGFQSPVSVALTGPHDRSFITYEEPQVPLTVPEALGPIGATHVGVGHALPDWVARLRARGTTIVGGVGWDHTGDWSDAVLDRLAEIDVFVPNDLEAMRYTRTDSALAAAKALAERVPLAVVTRGADGVIAVDAAAGTVTEAPSIPVDVRDPTGAGDVFVATFMAGGFHDWDLATRLRFAAACAAISVTGFGGAATAPTPATLRAFIARHNVAGDWTFLDDLMPTSSTTTR